jgi:5-methyltetrahydrofolate--homocysteine methyltransferase
MNQIVDPATRDEVLRAHTHQEAPAEEPAGAKAALVGEQRSRKVRTGLPLPDAPYLDRKVRDVPQLAEVWSYVNPHMLFWAAGFMKVRAVWQFFEAERDGNAVQLFGPGARNPLHAFRFGRQPRPDGLCLSDYLLDPEERRRDHIAIFVVTAGEGIRERAEEAKAAGEYFRAHALQALALETAEGCAEWLHRRIREDWGFPDPPPMTMQERFTSRYRGKRYSFGYGACPNLEDQLGIWKLLNPDEIGVHLTDGFMMDPEASVSALVFHHPDCAYFTADGA